MSGLEDLLFYTITEGKEMIPVSKFISVSYQYILHTTQQEPTYLQYLSIDTIDSVYSMLSWRT